MAYIDTRGTSDIVDRPPTWARHIALAFACSLLAQAPCYFCGISAAAAAQPAAPHPAAAPPAAPAPAREAPPPKGATPATVIDDKEVDGILGKEIRGATGENMGRIVDVLVDRSGHVRAAIIDFGGFLGVGSRKIAVDWRAIQFAPDGKPDRIVLALTRNQVRLAPEYKRGEPIVVLGPAPKPPHPGPTPPAKGSPLPSPSNPPPAKPPATPQPSKN